MRLHEGGALVRVAVGVLPDSPEKHKEVQQAVATTCDSCVRVSWGLLFFHCSVRTFLLHLFNRLSLDYVL